MRRVIIFLLFLSCCSKPKSSTYFDLPVIKKLSQLSFLEIPPPVISFMSVYVSGKSDSVHQSNFARLHDIYRLVFKEKYSEFDFFLFDALNQRIKIDTKLLEARLFFSTSFQLNAKISRLYRDGEIKGLVDKYCFASKDEYTLRSDLLTTEEANTVSYYFFINQYVKLNDDYNANTSFKKLDLFINFSK